MNFSFVHEFDIDVDNYWKIFLSRPFVDEMYRDLRMKSHQIVKQEDDGKIFHRVVEIVPTTPVPGFMQSIVKATDYTEIDRLDWSTSVMEVIIQTAMFKDRFDMKGLYTVSPLDGGKRCRREFRGAVKVSIPLIGGRIEKYMMEQLRDSYEIASQTTRRWVDKWKREHAA
jgi:hypothetical protein